MLVSRAVQWHVCRGHASEKPELPAALAKTAAKIQFLGPSADAMAALGDKVVTTHTPLSSFPVQCTLQSALSELYGQLGDPPCMRCMSQGSSLPGSVYCLAYEVLLPIHAAV